MSSHSKNKHFIDGAISKPRVSVHQAASSICEAVRLQPVTLPPPSVRQLIAEARRQRFMQGHVGEHIIYFVAVCLI